MQKVAQETETDELKAVCAQQAVGRAKNCSLRKEKLIKANTIKQLEKVKLINPKWVLLNRNCTMRKVKI